MSRTIGLALVGIGFVAMMVGAGTSDLEVTQGIYRAITGIGVASFGLLLIIAGVRLVKRG